MNEYMTRACHTLSIKLQAQSNKMIDDNSDNQQAIEQFNINRLIENTDPSIWKAVCLLTESRKESTTYVRKVRRVYTLCHLLFTINRKCSLPLHTSITDAFDTCGGSIMLKQILNRLGICARDILDM